MRIIIPIIIAILLAACPKNPNDPTTNLSASNQTTVTANSTSTNTTTTNTVTTNTVTTNSTNTNNTNTNSTNTNSTNTNVAVHTYTTNYSYVSNYAFKMKFGTSGAGNGQFVNPSACAWDGTYLYVGDRGNARIQKFDSVGNYNTQWGSAGSGAGQFGTIQGVSVANGAVYVRELGNNRAQKFSDMGAYIGIVNNTNTTGNGRFAGAGGIANNGQYYYASDIGAVQRFITNGTFSESTFNTTGVSNQYLGIAIGGTTIWAPQSTLVQTFDLNLQPLSSYAVSGLISMAADVSSGRVYGANNASHRICIYDATMNYQSQLGTTGVSSSADGQFNNPMGVCIGNNGDLWVADSANARIQKFGWAVTTNMTIITN